MVKPLLLMLKINLLIEVSKNGNHNYDYHILTLVKFLITYFLPCKIENLQTLIFVKICENVIAILIYF